MQLTIKHEKNRVFAALTASCMQQFFFTVPSFNAALFWRLRKG